MKRKTSDVPSRVQVYGLGEPLNGKDSIEEQLRLAARYRNNLIEVSHNQRAAYLAITETLGDIAMLAWEVKELNRWIDEGRDILNRKRQKDRKRTENKILSKCVRDLQIFRNRRSKWLAGARKICKEDPVIAPLLQDMYARVKLAKKALRADSGLYWGTYQIIEESVQQAEKDARKHGDEVRFRVWRGYSDQVGDDGRLSVQIQRSDDGLGMSVPTLMSGKDSRVRIIRYNPPPPPPPKNERHAAHRAKNVANKKPRQYYKLRFRIGTRDGKPVWGEWPILNGKAQCNPFDGREMPPDARIKRVTVHRRRVGTRHRWRLLVHLESETFRGPKRVDNERAAIDVGWRTVDGGLRVAYLVNNRDEKQQFVLPKGIIKRLAHADSLRGIRDGLFDAIRPRLDKWLKTHEHPKWLANSTRALDRWKSMSRLTRVVYRWRNRRFKGDEEIFILVDEWRKSDQHLFQWEASERDRALGHRKHLYRQWASKLTDRYSTIILENFDLRKMARKPKPEEESVTTERGSAGNRFLASVSEFRTAIASAASKRGCEIVTKSAVNTTRCCHSCKNICEWDAAMFLHHTCEHCGAFWDQDENACYNLLREESSDEEKTGSARSSNNGAVKGSSNGSARKKESVPKKDHSQDRIQLSENV